MHAFQLIFLMMTVSSSGEYLLFAITHAVPLGLYSFAVFYLNTNEIRDFFGLVPLNQDKKSPTVKSSLSCTLIHYWPIIYSGACDLCSMQPSLFRWLDQSESAHAQAIQADN